ncbi:tRNA lysidine(34) synthetase TilS [Corynebacterium lizhenjunii]|uniref:tRNA lysidine(34) synthetase TilS n=1 Tax=Corynebacterium lizhenjunii TaxID=2709394 RepID=UPI0013EC0F73|nr:tRNA lysidine(34) synthetase TilS [Corynebacterium lizhenjunii]
MHSGNALRGATAARSGQPFWPRRSPHFARLRALVRPVLAQALDQYPRVGIGLSGGPDSLALTAAVAAETSRAIALCVDHQLQPGSRAVAEAAANQAQQWGIDARVITIDAGNSEATARTARYRALGAAGIPVLVAHTAEDQAETLLLSALRGHATGMGPRAHIEDCTVLRPLLPARRADTLGACAELGLQPWHDPHNQAANFRRVRIRRDVIPLLGEILGGDAVAPLAQAATDMAADHDTLATAATNDCAQLAAMAEPHRRRAIIAWLETQGVEPSREAIGGIGKLCTHWHGQGGVAVAGQAGGARLEVARIGGKLALRTQH